MYEFLLFKESLIYVLLLLTFILYIYTVESTMQSVEITCVNT